MNPFFRKFLGLAVIAVLGACAQERADRIDTVQETGEPLEPWMDIARQHMFVEVREEEILNVNDVLADEETLLRALVAQFPSFPASDDLGDFIALIQNRLAAGGDPIDELKGFGGVLNRAFLDAAAMTLDPETGRFDPDMRVLLVIHGQILDYQYNESGNEGVGSGEITSITYVTKIMVPVGRNYDRGPILDETTATYWHVRIRDDGFREYMRSNLEYNWPFTRETMYFPDAMVNYIDFYRYQYKLWAEGEAIEIVQVKRRYPGDPSYTDLDRRTHPEEYYEGPENCIDILFQMEPERSIQGKEPPSYCMGRCKSPGLVNTNAG